MSVGVPRAVLVSRPTEYRGLVERHGTPAQARFFLATHDEDMAEAERAHERFEEARRAVLGAIPVDWRRSEVVRADLDRFLFEPGDVVLVLGQDGLVANTAKYLSGQVVIGLNPEPGRHEGVLVPHPPQEASKLLGRLGRLEVEERRMVEAVLDDGQRLLALNEVFLGHATHQSARYRLRALGAEERHSSSGVLVCTGTGATGWGRSLHLERHSQLPMPAPTEAALAFFVREAWPSVGTGASLTEGLVRSSETVEVISEMDAGGAVFGDGIEADRLEFPRGIRATVRLAEERLRLVRG